MNTRPHYMGWNRSREENSGPGMVFTCIEHHPANQKRRNDLKITNENIDEPASVGLGLGLGASFYVGDDGEFRYLCNVYPVTGEESWFAVLDGQVGNAPQFPKGCAVPVEVRKFVASAVRQQAQWNFEKLVSAVIAAEDAKNE